MVKKGKGKTKAKPKTKKEDDVIVQDAPVVQNVSSTEPEKPVDVIVEDPKPLVPKESKLDPIVVPIAQETKVNEISSQPVHLLDRIPNFIESTSEKNGNGKLRKYFEGFVDFDVQPPTLEDVGQDKNVENYELMQKIETYPLDNQKSFGNISFRINGGYLKVLKRIEDEDDQKEDKESKKEEETIETQSKEKEKKATKTTKKKTTQPKETTKTSAKKEKEVFKIRDVGPNSNKEDETVSVAEKTTEVKKVEEEKVPEKQPAQAKTTKKSTKKSKKEPEETTKTEPEKPAQVVEPIVEEKPVNPLPKFKKPKVETPTPQELKIETKVEETPKQDSVKTPVEPKPVEIKTPTDNKPVLSKEETPVVKNDVKPTQDTKNVEEKPRVLGSRWDKPPAYVDDRRQSKYRDDRKDSRDDRRGDRYDSRERRYDARDDRHRDDRGRDSRDDRRYYSRDDRRYDDRRRDYSPDRRYSPKRSRSPNHRSPSPKKSRYSKEDRSPRSSPRRGHSPRSRSPRGDDRRRDSRSDSRSRESVNKEPTCPWTIEQLSSGLDENASFLGSQFRRTKMLFSPVRREEKIVSSYKKLGESTGYDWIYGGGEPEGDEYKQTKAAVADTVRKELQAQSRFLGVKEDLKLKDEFKYVCAELTKQIARQESLKNVKSKEFRDRVKLFVEKFHNRVHKE